MDNMKNTSTKQNQLAPGEQVTPMKWYKFLIFFALPVSILLNIVNAKTYLTGGSRIVEKDVVMSGEDIYRFFPDVKTLDMVFGVLLIIVAIYTAFTWFCLFKHKKIGPVLLYVVYAINFCMNLGYSLGLISIAGGELVMSTFIGSIAGAAFAIWANHKYFTRRRDTFCN